jgi:hypothetical protein
VKSFKQQLVDAVERACEANPSSAWWALKLRELNNRGSGPLPYHLRVFLADQLRADGWLP